MSINNPLLYNAVVAGVCGGAGSAVNPAASASNLAIRAIIAANAVAIAVAVDASINADVTITSAGSTLAPTTGTIADAEISKSSLMRSIAAAAVDGQFTTVATPAADVATIAAGIVQNYGASVGSLTSGV